MENIRQACSLYSLRVTGMCGYLRKSCPLTGQKRAFAIEPDTNYFSFLYDPMAPIHRGRQTFWGRLATAQSSILAAKKF